MDGDDDAGGGGGGASRRLASDESREFIFRRDGKRARAPGGGGVGGAFPDEPCPAPMRMAPLTTRVALAAFKGTSKQEIEEALMKETLSSKIPLDVKPVDILTRPSAVADQVECLLCIFIWTKYSYPM